MSKDIPTLVAISTFLDQGTAGKGLDPEEGHPGLKFRVEDVETTLLQIMQTDTFENWGVWPVDVYNSVDGWHEDCVVLINIQHGGVFRFLAMDTEGQPVAYHEAAR